MSINSQKPMINYQYTKIIGYWFLGIGHFNLPQKNDTLCEN